MLPLVLHATNRRSGLDLPLHDAHVWRVERISPALGETVLSDKIAGSGTYFAAFMLEQPAGR